MKSSLEEKDFQLLNLYLDGELDPLEADSVVSRLKSDPQFEAALEDLRGLRQNVRDWSQALRTQPDGKIREVDCWPAVRKALARRPRRAVKQRTLSEAAVEALMNFFASPTVAPAALAVVIILGIGLREDQLPGSIDLFASRSGSSSSAAIPIQNGLSRASASMYVAPLTMPEPTFVSYRQRLRSGLSDLGQVNVPLPTILDREFVRGGLRSHGADIDWIRSTGSFELYPVEDRTAPPVIWVAQNSPH